ncbi:Undecaprenyl-phosphate 4-deoxy-4-formamido-L-arabinose transferase [Streptomyces sp. RB5]|uniref:Undecaprenyl-phosphate 4-deoxy-4-formamido-L-arabinose transferase n=1 Tax=Streptomyces smaragdinus TaxID=2585196 RepID=A0A7K0CQ20_9ACTN|nr:glycosyltransferase [Streptomyces smaragdinus]MQY15578.1 Undecaprenyl-phosphate 4-deoxy-4-formamido-L-arabinose transferase [Streptomyces smaragdinus]
MSPTPHHPGRDQVAVWVTVVIPAYNAAGTVGRALQSALNQTYPYVEVLVVDDASTDDTVEVVGGVSNNDPRVRLLRRPQNSGGVGAPRNNGIAGAAGAYVMFLDADDELPHRACEILVNDALESGCDITAGQALRVNKENGTSEIWAPEVYAMRRRVQNLAEFPTMVTDPIAAAKLYRVDFLRRNNVWFPEGVFYEDTYFSTVANCLAEGISVVTEPVYRWMWEAESGSITSRTGELRSVSDRITVHRMTDQFLLERGLWSLKVRKDSKFLSHDLRLYMRALAEGDAAFQQGFAEMVSGYLGSLSPEAFELCEPVERVRAFFLMYQEIEAALTTVDYFRSKGVLSSYLVSEGDRVYWSGDHMHLPDARRMLDVTELGIEAAPLSRIPLFAQLDAWDIDGSVLTFEGSLVNRFGLVGDDDTLKLTFALRNRRTKTDATLVLKDVEVTERHIHFSGRADLAGMRGSEVTESTVWNVAVIVDLNGKRSRSALNVRNLPIDGLSFRSDGTEIEAYQTISTNLALRTAAAHRKTFDAAQNDPNAPWMWWRRKVHPPLHAAPGQYRLAVVVPCYNVAKYLDDCLGSIAAQKGFAETQVILVDDGATDETPRILDDFARYYANVTVVHQPNGGLGNARNNGLAQVRAPYVTFLDSDDILGEDALAEMLRAAHRDRSDIVIGDLVNFPDRPYGPWKAYFGKGDRVVSDLSEVENLVFSGSACNKLFSTALLRGLGVRFGEGVHFEDAWVTLPAMLRAHRISLLDRPVYYYRGRPDGTSIMDSLWSRPKNYWDHLRLNHFLLAVSADQPPAIRRIFDRYVVRTYKGFLCNARNVMGRHQLAEIFPEMVQHYARIPDDVILEYATTPAQQVDHYAAKTANLDLFLDPDTHLERAPLRVSIDDTGFFRPLGGGSESSHVARVADPHVVVESVRARGDVLVVEGCLMFPGMDLSGPLENRLEFVFQTHDAKITAPLRQVYRRDLYNSRKEKDLYGGFYAEIPAAALAEGGFRPGDFRLRVHGVDGRRQRNVIMKARLPLHRLKGYAKIGSYRYMLTIGGSDSLHFRMIGRTVAARVRQTLWRTARELRIIKRRSPGWRFRVFYWLTWPWLAGKDIWLIGERSDTAQDNSYHFFRWMRQHKKRRNAYYVIDGGSADYAKVARYGNVIRMNSFKHRMYLLHATKLIGSYDSESYLVPTGYRKVLFLHRFGELLKYQRIFLQHGVIYNDVTAGVHQAVTSYDMIVTSSPSERDYLAREAGYGQRAVLAGLPRFDALRREQPPRPRILLMPTWRQWIVAASYKKQAGPAKTPFTQSEYLRFYRSLLTHPKLLGALEHFGVDLEFFPHYEIRPHLHLFDTNAPQVIVADPTSRNVQQAMKECSAMVTDYSSVFFDVAYMGIPVVYVPFDEEDFYGRHYKRGYFDLERHGFGPVCRTVDDAVAEIIALMARKFAPDPRYSARAESFFAFRDQDNCARVYEAIDALGSAPASAVAPGGPVGAVEPGAPVHREEWDSAA